MTIDEAHRQYQATLEAVRAARPWSTELEQEVLDGELKDARKEMKWAHFMHKVSND